MSVLSGPASPGPFLEPSWALVGAILELLCLLQCAQTGPRGIWRLPPDPRKSPRESQENPQRILQ
eukprot:6897619-Pyramimonas_sp.AAC.1